MEMTKKLMALALTLVAPAAFSQTSLPVVHSKKAKPALVMNGQTEAMLKTLREEIKRDKGDLAAKVKTERSERKELLVQQKAELAKVKASEGTREEKKQARQALHDKYVKLMKEAREKIRFERGQLHQDIASKKDQIKKLRQS
jgi:hypothetical protein